MSTPIKAPNSPANQPAEEEWPNTIRSRKELDSALEAGEKSGTSPHDVLEITKRTLTRRLLGEDEARL